MAPIAQGQGFMVGKPYSKAYTFFSQKEDSGPFHPSVLSCILLSNLKPSCCKSSDLFSMGYKVQPTV